MIYILLIEHMENSIVVACNYFDYMGIRVSAANRNKASSISGQSEVNWN